MNSPLEERFRGNQVSEIIKREHFDGNIREIIKGYNEDLQMLASQIQNPGNHGPNEMANNLTSCLKFDSYLAAKESELDEEKAKGLEAVRRCFTGRWLCRELIGLKDNRPYGNSLETYLSHILKETDVNSATVNNILLQGKYEDRVSDEDEEEIIEILKKIL